VSGWLDFEGRVEPLEWGRATYTILRLPPEIAVALAGQGAKRVEAGINDRAVNLALSRAPVVEDVLLWTGQSILDRLEVAPGEPLEIRLRPAPVDEVDTRDDVAVALRQGGASEARKALTPGRRWGLPHKIDTARTAQTRLKRIAALVAELAGKPA
jgi:hypothetical protein